MKKLLDSIKATVIAKLLKSRKVWMAIIGGVSAFLFKQFGIDPEVTTAFLMTVIATILGTAWEDGKLKANPNFGKHEELSRKYK